MQLLHFYLVSCNVNKGEKFSDSCVKGEKFGEICERNLLVQGEFCTCSGGVLCASEMNIGALCFALLPMVLSHFASS